MIYYLVHPIARQRAVEAVLHAPDGYTVEVKPPKRNLAQNAALHALLSEIAETRQWAGRKWSLEDWKRLAVSAWMRTIGEQAVMLPALDGHGFEVIYRRTSELTKAECSDLLAYVEAWAAEHEA